MVSAVEAPAPAETSNLTSDALIAEAVLSCTAANARLEWWRPTTLLARFLTRFSL
jgi:hypothetical protein